VLRFVAMRVAMTSGVLLAVSVLTFLMVSLLPGDPALQVLGSSAASEEAITEVRREMGLDKPLVVRYLDWLGAGLQGDLGRSLQTHQPVLDAILERLPVTIELIVLSLALALLVAVPLGVWAAYRPDSWFDKVASSASFGMLSMPPFLVGIALVYLFALQLGWLPATGWRPFLDDPAENLRRAVLPSCALALANIAVFMRLLRADMKATLQEDHVLLVRAKGMPTSTILFRHALRPSMFSVFTVLGIQIGTLVSGAVVIEMIFALPGVGRLLVTSILERDIIVVQGVVLVVALIYVLANLLVDLAYTVLDPRIRSEVKSRVH